jgi:hypothetical protein
MTLLKLVDGGSPVLQRTLTERASMVTRKTKSGLSSVWLERTPWAREVKSSNPLSRPLLCSLRLLARIGPFQGLESGSIPLGSTNFAALA